MAPRVPGVEVDRVAHERRLVGRNRLVAGTLGDVRFRVLVVVFGGIALLHREGLAGPKLIYLVVVAAAVAAAAPSAATLRRDKARVPEWRLVQAATLVGLVVLASLPIALAHGNSIVTWMRDASVYGLIASAPVLALDLRVGAGLRWVRWLLLAAGATCAASFVVEWIALRGYIDLPVNSILLPSLYLPAGLLSYATARGIRGSAISWWWLVAAAILGGVALTGTRGGLILLAAPLVQLALPGRRRTLAITLAVAASTVAAVAGLGHAVGVELGGTGDRLTSATTFIRHPSHDPSWRERVAQTHDSIDAWEGSPLLGVGPGHLFRWNDVHGVPRSSFLVDSAASYLAKFGVVGVAVLAVFFLALGRFLSGRLRQEDETRTGAEALLGFLATAGLGLVLGLPLEDKGFPFALMLLIALALPGRPDTPVSAGRLRRNAALLTLLVLCGWAVGAVMGRGSSSTEAALRVLPSIVNGDTPVVRVIGRFEYALWAGDGRHACALLTRSRRDRYGTTSRCIRLLSKRGLGDPGFARSRAIGPLDGLSGPVRRYLVRRPNGAVAAYTMIRVGNGRWRIQDFRELRRARAEP